MTIRCKGCHGVVWVQPAHTDGGKASVRCTRCGQQYVLESWKKSPRAERALAEKARDGAKQHGVDLPGAYSLLLGIMSIEDLRELGGAGSTACRTGRTDDRKKYTYDRAFQPAIDEGLLTPRQAAERGRREAYAAILASCHSLSRKLAFEIADNRTSLLEVQRERARRNEGALRIAVRRSQMARTSALTAALVLVFLLAAWTQRPDAAIPVGPGREHALGDARARTDGSGRVIQVEGPSPRSVLRAYCAADAGGARLEPLRVVASAQAGGRSRLGLFRDPSRPKEIRAITIQEDRDAGHWSAGDGRGPVVAGLAPEGAGRAVRKAPSDRRH